MQADQEASLPSPQHSTLPARDDATALPADPGSPVVADREAAADQQAAPTPPPRQHQMPVIPAPAAPVPPPPEGAHMPRRSCEILQSNVLNRAKDACLVPD